MSKVAVLKTKPETILEDYKRLMKLAEYESFLPRDKVVLLKINISWHHWYPACSTTPWQLEGVIKTLLDDGYPPQNIIGAHNRTVVVNDRIGEVNNKHKLVIDKYGLSTVYLNEKPIEWVRYEPKGKMLVLDKVYPEGILIPKMFQGKSIIHLPTVKTHVFTTITGAMKNAFGGLLSQKRHWTHSVIHETLVDLLTIQKEIHSGIFAVMDGTIAGSGPGPRCMEPHVIDYILASSDQVAIDAISAKIQGFDPLSLGFIRLAHEMGLGCGNPNEIEIVGEDISGVNFGFKCGDTFASKGQKAIYHGFLKPFEHILLRTPIVPWSYAASRLYHDLYWYPAVGKKRVNEMLKTDWGQLFLNYK
ncbi:MAG: DUF362 domain-containing protein [bacterium]